MSLLWYGVWGMIGLLCGFLIFSIAPIAIAQLVGGDFPQSIGRKYAYLAQTAIQSSVLVARENSIDLVWTGYDAHKEADTTKLDGERGHVRDDIGVTGRLFGKPFGFTTDTVQSYLSPLLAEIGAIAKQARREGNLGPLDRTDEDGNRLVVAGVTVPKRPQLVSLSDATALVSGDASRRDGEVAKSWADKSQEGFHERISFGQALLWLGSVGLGAGVVILSLRVADSGSTTVTSQGMLLLIGGTSHRVRAWIDSHRDRLLNIAGWGVVALIAAAIVVTGFLVNGPIAAAAVGIGLVIGAATLPVGILLGGPSIPRLIGAPMARGLWILAQLTVGKGTIVQLPSGDSEYCQLRGSSGSYFVKHDGERHDLEGDEGDLYLFGWRPLGLTEIKTERNLGPISATVAEDAAADGGYIHDSTDVGMHGLLPAPDRNEALIRLRSLADIIRGSSESAIIERGVREALDTEGGQQQFGPIATMVGVFGGVAMGAAIAYISMGGLG